MSRKYTHRIVRAQTNEAKGYREGALCSEHQSRTAAEKALARLESMSSKSMRGAFRIEDPFRKVRSVREIGQASLEGCFQSVCRVHGRDGEKGVTQKEVNWT